MPPKDPIANDDTLTIDDTNVTICASTYSFDHTDEAFPRGPNDQSVFTEYADHVAYRLWHIEDCLALKDLRVIKESMLEEFKFNRGTHIWITWLRDLYHNLVEAHKYETAARTYMLHLVACILFVDKSRVYNDAQYLWLFSSVEHTSWAWGCTPLTIQYTTFGVANVFETRQLAGYLCIFQCWIYEYFSIICDRRVHHTAAGAPRVRRWKARKSHPSSFVEYTRRLDALRLVDVIWTPYRDHRIHHEFDESYLYSSNMRWETLVARHLPERCLQHYKYVQDIPLLVSNVPARGIDK
ncbi:protein MAIN-LIKE 2-like [Vicia villosa]|uniref:protein MAIN-LIKE 2-like n=1 Tax=Vicia villosa TaxID=3911 RepID=UPI00273B0645|nr:protein MAIN-LIKE 2-like [Vicia villosa]